MFQQKITTFKNYLLFFIIIALFAVTLFFFIRWLYAPDVLRTLESTPEQRAALDKYSKNIYIHILNSTITPVEVGYETAYGCSMPGILSSTAAGAIKDVSVNIRDPRTYFNFVSNAFRQLKAGETASIESGKLPDVTSFEEAPEGAIYFSEEDEYKAEEAPNGTGQYNSGEQVLQENLPDPDKLALEKKAPQILIYHSHATESYMPNTAENYHTLNEKYNVLSVGSVMEEVLKTKYKYGVIHDKTYHDKESYSVSYRNSQDTITKQIEQNKSLKVLLDVHRDGFSTSEGVDAKVKKNQYTATIDGKKAARVMLVIGGANPNYPELEKYAVYIKKKMDKLYPGLFLQIVRKPKSKYNQGFSDYSMLIEVGCSLNTYEEAQYTGELMGNVIGEVLKDLEE